VANIARQHGRDYRTIRKVADEEQIPIIVRKKDRWGAIFLGYRIGGRMRDDKPVSPEALVEKVRAKHGATVAKLLRVKKEKHGAADVRGESPAEV
jgi:hypothetical protein